MVCNRTGIHNSVGETVQFLIITCKFYLSGVAPFDFSFFGLTNQRLSNCHVTHVNFKDNNN